jgi:hypothetical protein
VLDLAEAVAARAYGITGEIRGARVVVGPFERDLVAWRMGDQVEQALRGAMPSSLRCGS